MKAKDLIEKLQALDPDVEVLIRTVSGADYDTHWEPIEDMDEVKNDIVFIQRDGKYGHYSVPCVRLYE